MKIFVINGPNLNLVGKGRNSSIYGVCSMSEINLNCTQAYHDDVNSIEFFQSNHEGEIVDYIHYIIAPKSNSAIIINAGALSHTSYSIRDALEIFSGPKIEVHMSNIYAREDFRKKSVLSDVCDGVIVGFGADGYYMACEQILRGRNNV